MTEEDLRCRNELPPLAQRPPGTYAARCAGTTGHRGEHHDGLGQRWTVEGREKA